jgi:hypothetical protein
MFHLTAPVTKRQLELLQVRKRLERRMSFDTLPANGYGLAAQVEVIDAELTEIEQSKGNREVAA